MAMASDTMGQTPGGADLVDAADRAVRTVVPCPRSGAQPVPEPDRSLQRGVLSGRPFAFPPERDLRLFTLMERSCR